MEVSQIVTEEKLGAIEYGPLHLLPVQSQNTQTFGGSQVALVVEKPPAKAGDVRDSGLTLGSGRSPGEEHDKPLQYPCLENHMDRGTCRLQSVELERVGREGGSGWGTHVNPWLFHFIV